MMKWFRKHNKQLLAVFASALLVIWLGGTALQQMFERNPFNEPVGSAMGQTITGQGYANLKARLDVMNMLGLRWQVPWVNPWVYQQLNLQEREAQMLMMSMGQPLTGEQGVTDWWLLDLEARKMGVAISREEVNNFLAKQGVTGADLAAIRDQSKMATDDLFDTVADYLRVSYAAVLGSASVQVSDPELKDLFVRTHDQVNVRYAVLPAEAFEQGAAGEAIPEAELQALFEKYRDQMPGTGQYGFGYKIPDRVVVQYAGATIDAVAQTVGAIPEERARKFFEQHKAEFQPPQPPSTQPTTQPAVAFEQVKDQVIERLKKQEAAQMLSRAIEDVRTAAWLEYSNSKQALEAGNVPATLASVLEARAKDAAQSRRVPLVYKQIGPVTMEDARKEPGIGTAGIPGGQQGQMVDFATYAFSVANPPAADDKRQDSLQLSKYQPVVVRDAQGNDRVQAQYIFRVVQHEPARAPANLAEVREQVERDARTLRAMKKAEEAARQMADGAKQGNLQEAFHKQFPAAATQPATTQPSGATNELKLLEQPALKRARLLPPQFFAQFIGYMQDMREPVMPAHLAGVTKADGVIDATFALAGSSPASQPANRLTVVELPEQHAWVVVEVLEHKPATETAFGEQKKTLASELWLLKLRDFYRDWFDAEKIRERTGWQMAQR